MFIVIGLIGCKIFKTFSFVIVIVRLSDYPIDVNMVIKTFFFFFIVRTFYVLFLFGFFVVQMEVKNV